MPYVLATPKTFLVPKDTSVSITRLRILDFRVSLEPVVASSTHVSLQSGSGPYMDETMLSYSFSKDSTTRILAANHTGTTRAGQALEKGVFDELVRLEVIPAGTTV